MIKLFEIGKKIIDGKEYKYYDSFTSNAEATNKVKELRRDGYLARIHKQEAEYVFPIFHKGTKNHIEYEVYYREQSK